MIRLTIKNISTYIMWIVMGLFLLPAVSSAELIKIDNLTVSDPTFHSVVLKWTSPGKASSYDIRYSTSIINANNWDLAYQILGEPAPEESGTSQSMRFSGLLPNTTYHFAMKSCDGDTNCSALSNMPFITTNNDDFIRYVVYEDAEDGAIKRWSKDAWPPEIMITNTFDDIYQSRVIELQADNPRNKFHLHLEDGNAWNINTSYFENIVVKWSLNYSNNFFVYFSVETDCSIENMVYLTMDAFVKYLEEYYDNPYDLDLLNRIITEKPAYCLRGLYIYHFLDPEAINGQWHTFIRDLQADIREERPLGKILKVNGFAISNSGRVDDIKFGKAVNTGDDTTPPVPPTNLAAEAISSSNINLSWDASTDDVGIAEYRIYRDGLEIGISTITSYEDKGLLPLTTYTYKVAAYDYAGSMSDYSKSVSKYTLETSPEETEEQEEQKPEEPEEEQQDQEEEQGVKEIECFIMTSVFGNRQNDVFKPKQNDKYNQDKLF